MTDEVSLSNGHLRVPLVMRGAQVLLGLLYFINGLNWWVKILPFPSMHDSVGGSPAQGNAAVLVAMIGTGWMFGAAKLIELLTGISLLINRFVPLFLVISMTVAVTTFLMDVSILPTLAGWWAGKLPPIAIAQRVANIIFFGGNLLALQGFVMLGYLHCYRPMLQARASFATPWVYEARAASRLFSRAFWTLGIFALFTSLIAFVWLYGMIDEWLIPWSSLRLMAGAG